MREIKKEILKKFSYWDYINVGTIKNIKNTDYTSRMDSVKDENDSKCSKCQSVLTRSVECIGGSRVYKGLVLSLMWKPIKIGI